MILRSILRFTLSSAVAAGAVLAPALPVLAAPAVRVDYVALGDSYAAGVGAGAESTACRVTDGAFPRLWAEPELVDLTLAACSGATSADVAATQLGALSETTDLVSVTVGANDLGLTTILRTCATAPQGEACTVALAGIPQALATTVPAGVAALLTQVRADAPAAKLVVTGYPVPFAEAAQCPQLPLPPALRTAGNSAIAGLNQVLAAQAVAAGATFVDVTGAFAPHALCTPQPWLVGVAGLNDGTVLHPTAAGQAEGYLPAFIAGAGSVEDVVEWIRQRDTAASASPSPSVPASVPASTPAGVAAPPADGAGGGLPVTGPRVGAVVAVGVFLVVLGIVGLVVWRPRRVRTLSE
ncbi:MULTISPECIES: SGNH/GDSL hydrolase family protein [Catenuloplanes]|uniref:Lysophospholipase L1-like esterase n=1 Tax=Catenuloplanes niger TaxID=587534 RepID=A0AAE3ZIN8_9ACTN|nr:SGNH/GDSL hydrolase family protein [Catenuloplanes niger]MDR7320613.1 lysophospholipase L1-like esterase [Catenuloplanes niger]